MIVQMIWCDLVRLWGDRQVWGGRIDARWGCRWSCSSRFILSRHCPLSSPSPCPGGALKQTSLVLTLTSTQTLDPEELSGFASCIVLCCLQRFSRFTRCPILIQIHQMSDFFRSTLFDQGEEHINIIYYAYRLEEQSTYQQHACIAHEAEGLNSTSTGI